MVIILVISVSIIPLTGNNGVEGSSMQTVNDDVGVKELLWPFDEENATIDGGIYPVEAIVKNYGTLNESNFTVNATIWSIVEGYDDEIYYQDTFIVSLTLHPGDEVTIIFEDAVFYCPNSFFLGNYRIEITTELDQDENPINDMKTVFFNVYCIGPPPETNHTFYPAVPNGNNEWYVSNVTIELTAEGWCGIEVDYTCFCIDHEDWQIYNEPIVVSDDGEHTLAYYSVDIWGNEEHLKGPFDFKIDQTPPITTHEFDGILGENGWYVSDVTVTLNAEDVTSGVNYTKYNLNNGTWMNYTEPFDVTENGEYTLYYYSVDFAGNTEDDKGPFAFKIDQTPPTTTHEFKGVIGEDGWYVNDVTVTLNAEDETSGVGYTAYKIDDSVDWQIYTEPILITGDGEHTLYYYSVDLAGNEEYANEVSFKIDKTAPTINLTVERIGFRKWLITADVFDETSGIAKVEFYLDGGLLGTVTEAPFEWEWSGTGNGHVAQAIVYDNAGNSAQDEKPVSHSQSQKVQMFPILRRF